MSEKRDVRVEICDQVYHLRVGSDEDAAQIQGAAAYVDQKIRAVAAGTRDVDSHRLAVLAALHIADELLTHKARYNELIGSIERRSNEMGRLLDDELAS